MKADAEAQKAESLPLRERGLKSLYYHLSSPDYIVAPLAGAWIEIL